MSYIGPNTKGFDNTHMWDFTDYNSPAKPKMCKISNSLFDYVENNPRLTKFATLLKRANLSGKYSDPELNITLFIPVDEHLKEPHSFYANMDMGDARKILAVSSLDRKINGALIRSSPVSQYITRNPYSYNTIYVTNISNVTEINNCVKVIEYDVDLGNAIAHLTDGFIFPNHDHFIN